ncbi:isoprenyl transferase [Ancylomarina euxinus]|uniref:Isoprenyl transferase n=1 Tax=Ancylomarina euxinus TaxID=2283627 RepID=A0A425XY21_9BACT|nr:isoprenyl transferase [Ancylomarina euxinus]MCZ4695900.1 isoprenyl transferase [Ancylomarina euxinus]MUP16276.1 isoprenyl transferase [Ancylomarina euxinus]RRG19648.1 isoprenyl transferase [Ancylomarina euxinus]
MSITDKIIKERLPKHIAIIMDGNGRWAKERGEHRVVGHQNGVEAVRQTVEAAAELGISYLTLYAFSTENWNRPKDEVLSLMSLLVDAIDHETPTLMKNNVRLKAIGDLGTLPEEVKLKLDGTIEKTEVNTGLTLVLALSYSARWEIVDAVKQIALKTKNGELSIEDIDASLFENHLTTKGIPDPELIIRTSGEHRISNFLLWQIAYSEFYFTKLFWPDFNKDELCKAILDYQNRERRFGKISEQVNNK